MNLKHILLFGIFIAFFSCSTETTDNPEEDENPVTEKRITEVIGYTNGVEVVKQVFTYSNNKLSTIKEYAKSGSNWVEINTEVYTYNGTSITSEFTSGGYEGNKVAYEITNNNVSSISYIEDNEIFSGYENITFSNELLSSYTFFESDIDQTWYYKSNCEYDGKKILKINGERSTLTEPTWIAKETTTFNYTDNKLMGWICDYIEDDEFDEKIQYEYTNDFITKTTENTWDVDLNSWVKPTDINYSYDNDGYLIEQSITSYDPDYYEFTSNHIYDCFYSFETDGDFDQIKYTYEEGESNNYLLLYPEFLAHKTPNPYLRF